MDLITQTTSVQVCKIRCHSDCSRDHQVRSGSSWCSQQNEALDGVLGYLIEYVMCDCADLISVQRIKQVIGENWKECDAAYLFFKELKTLISYSVGNTAIEGWKSKKILLRLFLWYVWYCRHGVEGERRFGGGILMTSCWDSELERRGSATRNMLAGSSWKKRPLDVLQH